MPLYAYHCPTCGHEFDARHKIDDPAPDCPACGAEVVKVYHAPRVVYKGDGFYTNDNRKSE